MFPNSRFPRFRCVSALALGVSAAGLASLSTGCATCTQGTTQRMTVSSQPQDAGVFVNGQRVGSTPCSIELKRSRDYTIVLRKDGYEDLSYPLSRVHTNTIHGNLLIGGLVGLLVDLITGADYKFAPESIQTDLKPVCAVAGTGETAPRPFAASRRPTDDPTGMANGEIELARDPELD